MTRQRVMVVFECPMDEMWGEPDLWPTLTDAEILELAHEDVTSLLETGRARVIREELP